MIQGNELRIGNLVQDELGIEKMLRVYRIDEAAITCGDKEFSHPYLPETLKPIPLTPEVLEKCGFGARKFIEIGKYSYLEIDMTVVNTIGYRAIIQLEENDEGVIERYFMPHIKHLHQLQNLYYALTGTELTITL